MRGRVAREAREEATNNRDLLRPTRRRATAGGAGRLGATRELGTTNAAGIGDDGAAGYRGDDAARIEVGAVVGYGGDDAAGGVHSPRLTFGSTCSR